MVTFIQKADLSADFANNNSLAAGGISIKPGLKLPTGGNDGNYLTFVGGAPVWTAPVTPPQFDNDTSYATTAFVNNALGNFSEHMLTSVDYTLTPAQAGSWLTVDGMNPSSVTLPDITALPDGAAFTVQSDKGIAAIVTINKGPTALHIGAGSQEFPSIEIWRGEAVTFIKNGDVWRTKGTGIERHSFQFSNSVSGTNGYQLLPSGVLMQWGTGVAPIAANPATFFNVTFPVAFFTAPRFVAVTANDTANVSGAWAAGSAHSLSTTGFTGVLDVFNYAFFTKQVPYNWFAIGH